MMHVPADPLSALQQIPRHKNGQLRYLPRQGKVQQLQPSNYLGSEQQADLRHCVFCGLAHLLFLISEHAGFPNYHLVTARQSMTFKLIFSDKRTNPHNCDDNTFIEYEDG